MDQSQLNSLYQEYLGRDVDPSGLSTWGNQDPSVVASALQNSQEFQNLHPEGALNYFASNAGKTANLAGFNTDQTVSDPNTWEQRTYQTDPNNPDSGGGSYYVDPRTGNAYTYSYLTDSGGEQSGIDPASIKALAGGAALNDPLLQAAGLNTDPTKAEQLYTQKATDPHGYYSQIGDALENTIYGTLYTNAPSSVQQNALEQLKTLDPQTYYKNKIKAESQAAGWDLAQNRSDRATGHQQTIQSLIPDAIKEGMTPQQINDLYSQSASQASSANRQRIAGLDSGGMFGDAIPAITTIAAMAIAPELAPFLAEGLGGSALLGGAATGAILGGGSGAINAALNHGDIGSSLLKGAALGGVGGGVAGGISSAFSGAPNITEADMASYANSTPDPIQTMSELKSMTPEELAQAFGPGAGETSSNIGKNIASKLGSNAAKMGLNSLLSGSGSTTGGLLGLGGAAIAGSTAGDSQTSDTTSTDTTPTDQTNDPYLKSDILKADTSGLKELSNPEYLKLLQKLQQHRGYAEGGEVEDHNPQFYSEGGLNSLKNTYVQGDGDGTSDSVPAMLANGEFVIPADVVASLGNGSNDSGSKVLNKFLETIRAHKQKHDTNKLPPDSKGPLAYLTDAKRKTKV